MQFWHRELVLLLGTRSLTIIWAHRWTDLLSHRCVCFLYSLDFIFILSQNIQLFIVWYDTLLHHSSVRWQLTTYPQLCTSISHTWRCVLLSLYFFLAENVHLCIVMMSSSVGWQLRTLNLHVAHHQWRCVFVRPSRSFLFYLRESGFFIVIIHQLDTSLMVSSTTCIGRSESPLIEIKHIRHLSTKDVQVPNRMLRFSVGCDLDVDVIQEFGE